MKYGIDMGHTINGVDYGAVGIKAESILTREVGTRVISKLQSLGHTVVNCTVDRANSLGEALGGRTTIANNNNVDLFVSIHFNCFNGSAHGTEIWTYGGKELAEARNVLNNIVALGYTNRGIKDGSKLYVLRNTKAKALLIECCFCDNKDDMNKYNAENMANAIVKGLAGETVNIQPSTPVQKPTPKPQAKKTWEINIQGQIIKDLQYQLNVQCNANLKVDGYCGDNTINKLITVRQGARGEITRIIQKLLIRKGYSVGKYGADSVFGNGTYNAVCAIQKANGLSVDGIVGINTWKALLRK